MLNAREMGILLGVSEKEIKEHAAAAGTSVSTLPQEWIDRGTERRRIFQQATGRRFRVLGRPSVTTPENHPWIFQDGDGIPTGMVDLLEGKLAGVRLGAGYALHFEDAEATAALVGAADKEFGPALVAVLLAALDYLAAATGHLLQVTDALNMPVRQQLLHDAEGAPEPTPAQWLPDPAVAAAVIQDRDDRERGGR